MKASIPIPNRPGVDTLSEDVEFQRDYGGVYEKEYAKFKRFVERPEVLRAEVASDIKSQDELLRTQRRLPAPSPDQFDYRLVHYRGLVNFTKRLRNYVIAKTEPFGEIRKALPTRLDIEPISHCNFRCKMCQVSAWENGRRAENMSLADFKSLIDEQYGLCEVKLQGFGEPLMHKDYMEMIRYLVDRDIWVRTTVNGSLLHIKENYKRIIDAGVGDLNISVDGATREVFEGIRVRSNFDDVSRNLKLLNDYAESKGKKNTMMWVVIQKANRHQVFEFVELAQRLNFKRLSFSVGLSDWGQEKWSRNNRDLATNEFTQDEIDRLRDISDRTNLKIALWDLKAKFSTEGTSTICHWPFTWAFVGSDLRVVPCCMIGNPDVIDLGDARDFSAVWNGPDYKSFRRAHLEGNIPGYCTNCYKSTNAK